MKLKKGSKAARDFMARLRAKVGKKKRAKKNPSKRAKATKLARRQADHQRKLYGGSPAEYRRSVVSRLKRNPAKIAHGAVMKAHDAWAHAHQEYGEWNYATSRALGAYQDARERYEREHGKPFVPKHRRAARSIGKRNPTNTPYRVESLSGRSAGLFRLRQSAINHAKDSHRITGMDYRVTGPKGEVFTTRAAPMKRNPSDPKPPTSKKKFYGTRSKARALKLAKADGIHAPVAIKVDGGFVVYQAYAPNPNPRGVRNGYVFKIGDREMGVTGIGEDEAKGLAKKLARMSNKRVEVREGKI